MSTEEHGPVISEWLVQFGDRIVGVVANASNVDDGTTIITSPVVSVRSSPQNGRPVAVTRSGSHYRLGRPSAELGADGARAFLERKSEADPAHRFSDSSHPLLTTQAMRLG